MEVDGYVVGDKHRVGMEPDIATPTYRCVDCGRSTGLQLSYPCPTPYRPPGDHRYSDSIHQLIGVL